MEQPLFEGEIPGLKKRNFVDLDNLTKDKFYYYNGTLLGQFINEYNNYLRFFNPYNNKINFYYIVNIKKNHLPTTALLEDMVLEEINVQLNKLKEGRYYFYNGALLGMFIRRVKNKLIFRNGNIIKNYFIIQIHQNEIPSTALLEEVEPQTIHLEDVSLVNDNDYFGGKRRKSKKTKKKSKKSKKRYSRKYR
jgi:hypothetical protein